VGKNGGNFNLHILLQKQMFLYFLMKFIFNYYIGTKTRFLQKTKDKKLEKNHQLARFIAIS